MDAPAPAAAVPDLQSKQELVDRFARLKTVWLDLASTSVERDELAAVAEELRLLGSRQSTVALCTQRHAAAKAQHEALQRTLRSASRELMCLAHRRKALFARVLQTHL